MFPLILTVLCVMFLLLSAQSPAEQPMTADALVKKIQQTIASPHLPAAGEQPALRGQLLNGTLSNSTVFPGTEHHYQVYVPAEYDPAKPACLLLKLDGLGKHEAAMLDGLIADKSMPITIGVGISPGTIWNEPPGTPDRKAIRWNRSYEFDSTNDQFADFILNELLAEVQKLKTDDGRAIHLSADGNDRAATGASTGGIGAFTLAWQRPDQFTRVYSVIGTFVSMRGGHDYPALIRKTEPKPIRIFLEDGSADTWNPLFGSWFDANVNMESALTFAGYDAAHAWGTHGHDSHPGAVVFPDVMRWLWRDYPTAVKAGTSQNSTLTEITVAGEGWSRVRQSFKKISSLAADRSGDVYLSDSIAGAIYKLGANNTMFADHLGAIAGQAFGTDGTLYAVVPDERKVIAIDEQGKTRTVADRIAGRAVVATREGSLYISAPGEHADMPSLIWRVKPGGETVLLDQGLSSVTGIAFSPDRSLFYAAENSTQWIYSWVVQPDGTLAAKQRYFWLHMTDIPNNSGAEEIALDKHGNLYAATRMGIQVCDQNGRVRAILPLPAPCGPVRSICFAGENADILYATDGRQLFKRHLKVGGFAQWSDPMAVKNHGAG